MFGFKYYLNYKRRCAVLRINSKYELSSCKFSDIPRYSGYHVAWNLFTERKSHRR